MKKIFFLCLLFYTGIYCSFSQANTETVSFKVEGNCEMCKNRIENAILPLKGVISADWNVETKLLKLTYKPQKIALKDIHQIIAEVGHSTDSLEASPEAYEKLHHCCKYKE